MDYYDCPLICPLPGNSMFMFKFMFNQHYFRSTVKILVFKDFSRMTPALSPFKKAAVWPKLN